MDETYNPESEYELIVPRWDAACPEWWPLEICVDGEFIPAAGRTLLLVEGNRLRRGHDQLMQAMLDQKFIREVHTDADSQ